MILILVGMTVLAPQANASVVGGAMTGAATGAAVGSVVPVVGTAAGAVVGGIVGAVAPNVTTNVISYILSYLSSTDLWIMSWFVTITGSLLNISITLTLHIKDFVNSTEGVYLVWQTIRDISGLFIIFMLLYASFKIILGFDTVGGVGNLIKNIVIAGILINFSFFITSLLIDASNIVSLALYNGIVGSPTATTQTTNGQGINCPTTTAGDLNTCVIAANTLTSGNTGNLGSIFMDKLKPQTIYDPKNTPLTNETTAAPLQILLQGAVGVVLMFTMGMSFLLASLAFVARLAILIMLLAFSPIWFASMIFPILKEKSKKFTDMLYAQLVFMPVYLLLLYAAMTVLKYTTVFNAPSGAVFSGTGVSSFIPTNLIVLAINDFFILFLLNMPLVVAFSYGSSGTDWLKGAVNKVGAANVWKNVGSWTGSRTLGRAAYWADTKATPWLSSKSSIAGSLSSKAFSSVNGAGFGIKKGGYEDRLKAKKEAQDKLHEKIGRLDRSNYKTEKEFEDAQEVARGYQEKYRANLPWKSTIMGFMLDNRANRQSQRSLSDEANLKKNRGDLQVKKNQIASLQKILNDAKTRGGLSGSVSGLDDIRSQIESLGKEAYELDAAIKRGSGSKEKGDIAKMLKRLGEEAAKSGGSKDEPKEPPKDEPKKPQL